MREGLEPELSVAMDVMYPMAALTRAAAHSRKTYPHTPLRLYVEALGGVIKPVLDRDGSIGVIGSLPLVPDELQSEPLPSTPLVTVVSPSHPLAKNRGVVSVSVISKHVQLVLSDRTVLTAGRDFGVLSPLTWRLADLGAKNAWVPQGRPGMGIPPSAHGAGGPRRRSAGQRNPRRSRSARSGDADARSLSKGCTAGARRPSLHRATQAELSGPQQDDAIDAGLALTVLLRVEWGANCRRS